MTTNGFHTRLARLEQRRNPPPDPRIADEARERVVRAVVGLASTMEPDPDAPPFDLLEAVTAVLEARRRGEE